MSKHLEVEMGKLKDKLLSLTSLVEDVFKMAINSLHTKDRKMAKQVVELDNDIDDLEVECEEDCLKILALHQPVAIDLRYIVGVLKMNNDLERIGDLAVNIAERSNYILKAKEIPAPFDFTTMSAKAMDMLADAIKSLMKMDIELARDVINRDSEVDEINKNMYFKVFDAIKESPDDVATLINYLAISRNIERIADFTTNIAEDVIYMVEGSIVRHSPDLYDD
ncbi:MAG: phosphate signaling complex protein PhoU [Bacteriovoracaceae bacterium]|nr:phosphate signaling complex protein PhoU [Bacteriovoracaceae bacterium]